MRYRFAIVLLAVLLTGAAAAMTHLLPPFWQLEHADLSEMVVESGVRGSWTPTNVIPDPGRTPSAFVYFTTNAP